VGVTGEGGRRQSSPETEAEASGRGITVTAGGGESRVATPVPAAGRRVVDG